MARRYAFAGLLFGLASNVAFAAAIVSGFNANTLPRTDDGSSAEVALGFTLNLYGSRVSTAFVNNNGNISFGGPLGGHSPARLQELSRRVIAPFFADVDTSLSGNPVTYGPGTFEGRPAFAVNWIGVPYYSAFSPGTSTNDFQVILVSRADRADGDFDIVFNYDRIAWEAGTASGGDDSGRGGDAARAGFALAQGAPGSAVELQGSARSGAFLNGGANSLVYGRRGSNVAGRHVFEIRAAAASQVSARTPFANAASEFAGSDASGRWLVFQSASNTLVDNDTNPGTDVFLLDTLNGGVELLSLDFTDSALSGDAVEPAISADASVVTFVAADSSVGNQPEGSPVTASSVGVYVRHLPTGSTHRVGEGVPGRSGTLPRPSSSGRYIVYVGLPADADTGASGQRNIFRAEFDPTNEELAGPRCISCKVVDAQGAETSTNVDGISAAPDVSGDGRVVVWESQAKNPVAGASTPCTSAQAQVFRRDLASGVVEVASVVGTGGSCGAAGARSGAPRVDQAGRRVVFESDKPLIGADSNGVADIYLRDAAGSTVRVSESSSGGQGNAAANEPAISGDGGVVAFSSGASNLGGDPQDTNNAVDLFAKSLGSGRLVRLAGSDVGGEADSGGRRAALSFDGSLVAFEAASSNLAYGAVANRNLVYQRRNPEASPVLKSATWWRETEGGWGLFIFDQGNLLAPAWFTHDTDGEPTWFLAPGAFPQADGSYRGELYRLTGVPFDRITGNALVSDELVGDIELRYSGESQLAFRYRVGTVTQEKQLTRFPFGSRAIACRANSEPSRAAVLNYSDIWYGGAQSSGWGLFLNHVDNSVFDIWYTYDADGEPLFLVVLTERQPDGSFVGDIFRQPNGTPFSQINNQRPSGDAVVVGRATFRFSNGERGTFSYTIGAVDQSKPIERLQVGELATRCESVDAG